jgi:hypothetical protein
VHGAQSKEGGDSGARRRGTLKHLKMARGHVAAEITEEGGGRVVTPARGIPGINPISGQANGVVNGGTSTAIGAPAAWVTGGRY